jgi:hypothetical protein
MRESESAKNLFISIFAGAYERTQRVAVENYLKECII